ncbi:IL10RB [Branchiostoma lanceolatum]|uniref:IL10RB protein n=1 Tax=Branchiostoma lanceolatum TaxID=7740 RepID=A0A8J9Z0G0_BRALA|nr:IL10RB [Branchiostoma lanceolatum]
MAAAWVQLVVLVVFCCTTIDDVLATTNGDLESSLQGPPDKPINVRFESVNFNHTLRWDLAPNHDNSTLFTVQYIGSGHRDSSPSLEDWQEKAKCINITGLCCVLLNELGTDGNWWARVRALNPYGTSDWAESKVFEPFEDTIIGVPDLEVLQAKTDRLTLRVKAPKTPFYNSNGRRMRMSHFYSRITWLITYQEVGSSFPPGEKETTDKDVVLNHLYPGKHYCITARGRYMDEVGETGRICADTQEDVPSAGARSLSFSVDDCTKYPLRNIRLTWQPPAEEKWNGKLQEYKISYKDVGASYEEMTHSMVPGDVTNFTIRDLSASEEYVVDVAACTSTGCSERRALHNMLRVPPLKTDTSPYAPNVSVAPLSSTSMQVSWSPLEDACVQGYMVQFDPEVAPVRVSSVTTMNLTGLVPGTEYHVCVKARLPSADVEFGECARGLGVYAQTQPTTANPSTLVQTVLPILAVVVLLVVLCVLVLWMRGSPFLSISKINIVLPPVLVEIKETKDSTSLEPISSSWNKESMDDLDSIRTNVIRQKSKFVKSLQNLPDTLSLDDDAFQTDEKKTLLSWKSDKDLVVKVVISQQKGDSGSDKDDEPSSPTSTDSGNISGPCSLITDSGGDEEQSNVPVETYRLDSPVSFQKKNPFDSHVQASSDSPRPSQEIGDPGQAMASWPDNQTTSSEIDSYVRATDGTFEDDADEGFMPEGCKGQSNPYVLAESLPLLAPPFNQGFIRPNPHVQPTIAPPPNPLLKWG